jgi:hypothetical protein
MGVEGRSRGNRLLVARSAPPVLVTGMPRSGTTWVGKTVASGAGLTYLAEPLNIDHPGIISPRPDAWYLYITDGISPSIEEALLDMAQLRYPRAGTLFHARSRRDAGRVIRDWGLVLKGRVLGQRALIKDPYASFSIPWFIERLACRPVVVMRNPFAIAASMKRLGWRIPTTHLLRQSRLMRDVLAPYGDALERDQATGSVVGQAALLWRMVYETTDRLRETLDLLVVRHEDIARDPSGGFQQIYDYLGLRYSDHGAFVVQRNSSPTNPAHGSTHSIRRDSRATLDGSRAELTESERELVRQITAPGLARHYPDTAG